MSLEKFLCNLGTQAKNKIKYIRMYYFLNILNGIVFNNHIFKDKSYRDISIFSPSIVDRTRKNFISSKEGRDFIASQLHSKRKN